MKALQLPHVFRREYLGADVGGLSAVDLKAAATRVTGTNIVDLHGHDQLMVFATLVIVGATTAGDCDIELIPFAEDGTTQLGNPVVIGILSHRAAATVKCSIGLSVHGAAAIFGGNITGSSPAASGCLKAVGKVKVAFNRRVVYDSATSAALTLDAVIGSGPGKGS